MTSDDKPTLNPSLGPPNSDEPSAGQSEFRTITHVEKIQAGGPDREREPGSPNTPHLEFQFGAPEDRYRVLGFIGEGGMGEVFRATDRLLGRDVALKYLKDATTADVDRLQHFWDEVSTAGLLDHPNIPPVFDVGIDHQSRPFYVMRLIRGQSLREFLKTGSPELLPALSLFLQVCAAVEFAHARDILHLDLKPENVMVGPYEEVYLVDWGLSSRTDAATNEPAGSTPTRRRQVRGTPAYMSPEQSRRDSTLTAKSDVFSLAVLLYELITGQHPYLEDGDTSDQVLARSRRGEVNNSPGWEKLNPELQDILRDALQPAVSQRTPTVAALSKQVREILTGAKERERKARLAESALARAHIALKRRDTSLAIIRDLSQRLREEEPESWSPTPKKRAFWQLQDDHVAQEAAAEIQHERAMTALREANALLPDDESIRDQLADLYLERFERAEIERREFELRFFEAELRRLEMPTVDAFLEGDGRLQLQCQPSPFRATLYELTMVDRRLTPSAPRDVTNTMVDLPLAMGQYWIRCEHPDFAMIEAPIAIGRGQTARLNWRLRRRDTLGEGFVQIPPSSFIMGGDRNTFMSLARHEPWVDEFAIARYPVTWEDYHEYLQSVADRDIEAAKVRLPSVLGGGEPSWDIDSEGRVRYAHSEKVQAERSRWPIFEVTYEQAMEYVAWRSQRDGRRYDLPTDTEWEKAARGVDGRVFPWGDHYDATFCKNAGSTEGKTQPEPIGVYDTDCSPYGVRDLAGGIREWCSSWFSRKNDERLVRGGSWNFGEIGAHAAYRLGCTPNLSYPFIGFRLVHRFAPYSVTGDR